MQLCSDSTSVNLLLLLNVVFQELIHAILLQSVTDFYYSVVSHCVHAVLVT